MRKTIHVTWAPLLAALLLSSCKPSDGIDPRIDKLGRATGPVAMGQRTEAPVQDEAPAGGAQKPIREGTVLERIQVPNYTYLRLGLADGREAWAAVPRAEIEVGTKARVVESIVMHKFTSPSLGRTFESIVFGTLDDGTAANRDAGAGEAGNGDARGVRESPLPPGHPPI
jgi:hypothetical protein